MTRKSMLGIAFVILAAMVCTNMAQAQTTKTNSLNIQATVAAACRIDSVATINFGAYDPTSPDPADGTGNMVFRCVKNTTYKTYLVGTRSMTAGGDTLNFELYTDSGRANPYPSTNSASGTSAAHNTAITQDIYGRIAASQDVGVNSYSTALVATVEY
jgi:spore coat protein U-like protein